MKLPHDWQLLSIGDIADVKGGKRLPKGRELVDYDTGHPYIRVSDMYEGGIRTEQIRYVPKDVAPSISKYRIFCGELFITVAGTLGVVGEIPSSLDGANLTENADKLTDIKINRLFLKTYLRSPFVQRIIEAQQTQNAQPKLAIERIKEFPIPIPPPNEQAYIARVISAWDSATEKTERLIALRIKQKACLLRRVLSLPGLETTLNTFLTQVSRPVPKPTQAYWALGIRSHGKGTFQRFVEDPSGVDMEELYAVNCNDLIVNITFAWEGAIALVREGDSHCLVSHRFPTYEIDPEKADPCFVKQIVNCKPFFSQLALISPGGAGRNRVLNKKDFLKLRASLPPLSEQRRLAQVMATMDSLIEREKSLLSTFKIQKRGLMQKLLTGQWRVPLLQGDNEDV